MLLVKKKYQNDMFLARQILYNLTLCLHKCIPLDICYN